MPHRPFSARETGVDAPPAPSGRVQPHALLMRGVHKEWAAGCGGCTARVRVLRGVQLYVRVGEIVGISGPAGAGKTTLLLCAAGLLRADAGTVTRRASWVRYLASEPRAALRLSAVAGLPSSGTGAAPRARAVTGAAGAAGVAEHAVLDAGLILVDELPEAGLGALGELLRRRAAGGDAVVVASRDAPALACVGARTLTLAGGVLGDSCAALPDQRRKRAAARSNASSPESRADASMRSTCGLRLRSPQ